MPGPNPLPAWTGRVARLALTVLSASGAWGSVPSHVAAQDVEVRRDAAPSLPEADIFTMAPMRDGVGLATHILLPEGEGPHPAILMRSPYKDGVIPWGAYGHQRYLDAGYAVVWQSTRGTGASEGAFRFVADERNDGYDAVEWIAAQPWSDGNVGMDHGSYLGMTQLAAAATDPPHLKAIIPHVPSVNFFRETPYAGGVFMRYHILNWLKLMSVDAMTDVGVGFMDPTLVLDDPEWLARLRSRPLIEAADGFLEGDRLAQYRGFVEHGVLDDYWREIQFSAEDYAKMDVPMLLISGNFDPSIGTLEAWKGIERHAPNPGQRHLLIGPWTHGQSYSDGVDSNGPYEFGGAAQMDLQAMRIAFYDRYLRDIQTEEALPRVRVFVTGSNEWREFDAIPIPGATGTRMYLSSGGRANSSGGDGVLRTDGSSGPPDHVTTDPEKPVVVKAELMTGITYYHEAEERNDVLVYSTPPLDAPTTIVGEPEIILNVSAETRDADVIVRMTEVYPDGTSVALGAGGVLRLRYRDGFEQERLLVPGETYRVRLPLGYVSHTVSRGNRLRIDILGAEFPLYDPNPHTGEPIATATRMQRSTLTLHHDGEASSYVVLPTLDRIIP